MTGAMREKSYSERRNERNEGQVRQGEETSTVKREKERLQKRYEKLLLKTILF